MTEFIEYVGLIGTAVANGYRLMGLLGMYKHSLVTVECRNCRNHRRNFLGCVMRMFYNDVMIRAHGGGNLEPIQCMGV